MYHFFLFLLSYSSHLAGKSSSADGFLLTFVTSVNLTTQLWHVNCLHLLADWHYQKPDRTLWMCQYISDQEKTCLFVTDRKIDWNLTHVLFFSLLEGILSNLRSQYYQLTSTHLINRRLPCCVTFFIVII